MKFAKVLVISLLVFPLLSCSKKEKERLLVGEIPGASGARAMGTITLGIGGNSFSAPTLSSRVFLTQNTHTAQLKINNIELTSDGTNWISIISSPITIPIAGVIGAYHQISSSPVSVTPNEYNGLRITLGDDSKIALNEIEIGDFNPYPLVFYFSVPGYGQLQNGYLSQLELTSSNGFLTPFTISESQNTNLILGLTLASVNNKPEWAIYVGARTTSTPQ